MPLIYHFLIHKKASFFLSNRSAQASNIAVFRFLLNERDRFSIILRHKSKHLSIVGFKDQFTSKLLDCLQLLRNYVEEFELVLCSTIA